MNRRGFLARFAAIPAAFALNVTKAQPRTARLPIDCDLSFSSLQWALKEGKERGFGRARVLIIGPENLFVAREMLGAPGTRYNTDPLIAALMNESLIYDCRRDIPMNYCTVKFEHGIIESHAP